MLFTKDHEWVKEDQGSFLVGITEFAVRELGDIVFIDLPLVNAEFKKGQAFSVVESTKTASDVYAPFDMVVLEVNTEVKSNPGTLNRSPFDKGWLVKVSCSNKEQLKDLLSEEQYRQLLK
ncbi:MAG: glycine cleavage system protein GcvH [Deltaproteobacteria bacterium]|nr:glycine cleavage system protein GcvH [Deltaproteobacteria bacterium]